MMNDDKEQKEKKKYAFFSDPDTIAKRAEAAVIVRIYLTYLTINYIGE